MIHSTLSDDVMFSGSGGRATSTTAGTSQGNSRRSAGVRTVGTLSPGQMRKYNSLSGTGKRAYRKAAERRNAQAAAAKKAAKQAATNAKRAATRAANQAAAKKTAKKGGKRIIKKG